MKKAVPEHLDAEQARCGTLGVQAVERGARCIEDEEIAAFVQRFWLRHQTAEQDETGLTRKHIPVCPRYGDDVRVRGRYGDGRRNEPGADARAPHVGHRGKGKLCQLARAVEPDVQRASVGREGEGVRLRSDRPRVGNLPGRRVDRGDPVAVVRHGSGNARVVHVARKVVDQRVVREGQVEHGSSEHGRGLGQIPDRAADQAAAEHERVRAVEQRAAQVDDYALRSDQSQVRREPRVFGED